MTMGVHVVGDGEAITAQTRAYAEYRVFATLAAHTHRVSRAQIVLRHENQPGAPGNCTCEVTLLLLGRRARLRIRAQGLHPYSAIDRAVARLAVAKAWRVS
jgi:ribosome-associated translation inhibitor RaiA